MRAPPLFFLHPGQTISDQPRFRALSLGAGVQSSTLLALSAEGILPKVDYAIQHVDALESFLRQPPDQPEQAEIAERRLMTMLDTSHAAFASGEG